MEDNSIDILVEKVSAGDHEAFRKLSELKHKDIYYIAYSVIKNHHDAEDITQNVIMKIFYNISKLKSVKAFNSWMYRLTINESNDLLRKHSVRKEDLKSQDEEIYEGTYNLVGNKDNDFLPEKHLEESEIEKYIAKIIDKMPPKLQRCFYLFYYEGLKYKEIAEALDMNVNTVGSNVKRAKAIIKNEIENNTDFDVTFEDEDKENE